MDIIIYIESERIKERKDSKTKVQRQRLKETQYERTVERGGLV